MDSDTLEDVVYIECMVRRLKPPKESNITLAVKSCNPTVIELVT